VRQKVFLNILKIYDAPKVTHSLFKSARQVEFLSASPKSPREKLFCYFVLCGGGERENVIAFSTLFQLFSLFMINCFACARGNKTSKPFFTRFNRANHDFCVLRGRQSKEKAKRFLCDLFAPARKGCQLSAPLSLTSPNCRK
jgi:hypothetical protein